MVVVVVRTRVLCNPSVLDGSGEVNRVFLVTLLFLLAQGLFEDQMVFVALLFIVSQWLFVDQVA